MALLTCFFKVSSQPLDNCYQVPMYVAIYDSFFNPLRDGCTSSREVLHRSWMVLSQQMSCVRFGALFTVVLTWGLVLRPIP